MVDPPLPLSHLEWVHSQGARNVEEEEKEKVRERASAFRGVGFRLGDTVEPSEQIQSGPSARGPEKVGTMI